MTHTVTVPSFLMMETEVTQEQYESVTGSNPSVFPSFPCPTCPVGVLTWQMAKDFCATTGARLPSEAEWEYAARGGTTTRWYCDEVTDEHCLDDIANYFLNSLGNILPAGEKIPNAYGLHDMLGNIGEWTEDCWQFDYTDAPDDGSPNTTGACLHRPVRGGDFNSRVHETRVSARASLLAGQADPKVGVRCAQ
jgi:formylglycine-generating enzyme required for sulfatase activity